mgnify:CR=1 FL=1
MQSPSEGLIYLIVLAVAYATNYLFKRFGPNREPEPPKAEVDEGPIAQEPVQVPVGPAAAPIAAAGPLLVPLLRPQVALAKAMLPTQLRGQLPGRALMSSKRNKQTAIAMAVILGPCRALEPDAIPSSFGR